MANIDLTQEMLDAESKEQLNGEIMQIEDKLKR